MNDQLVSDTEAVEQFARFVRAQQPASQPWQPVTDYSFEARKAIEGQHPQLIKDVFQPVQVVDVGCGTGFLVKALGEIDVWAFGCDKVARLSEPGLQLTDAVLGRNSHSGWILRHDITDPPVGPNQYDLVICREVLEHLTVKQIMQAVRNLVRLSSKYVYLTTRFHPNPSHLLDVLDHDDLDPTHITLLNKDFLRLLFVLEGCTSRDDLAERMDWQHKGRCLVFEVA